MKGRVSLTLFSLQQYMIVFHVIQWDLIPTIPKESLVSSFPKTAHASLIACAMASLLSFVTLSTANAGGHAAAPAATSAAGALSDADFNAGLTIESQLKQCKKYKGVVQVIASTTVFSADGKFNVSVEGKDPAPDLPIVGVYAKKPTPEQLKSLIGRKFCLV